MKSSDQVKTIDRVELRNIWLLFNWGRLYGFYHYRRDAMEDIRKALGADGVAEWRDYFDIRRGDLVVMPNTPVRVHLAKREARTK